MEGGLISAVSGAFFKIILIIRIEVLYLPSIFRKAPGKLMLETRSLKGPPSPAVRQLFNLYENFTAASTEIIMRESILDLFRLMVSK